MSDENNMNLPEVISNNLPANYTGMLEKIKTNLPAVEQNSSNFYKSHSQFMLVTLDMTALTPIRRIKNVLAEIDRTRSALEEAEIKVRKQKVKLKKKQAKLAEETDPFKRELLEIEIDEIILGLKRVQNSAQGAIRKLTFLVEQHNQQLKALGVDHITEEQYEREEIRYHIMTAFKQALTAARSRGGIIDEGNQIYMFDLGVPGMQAQSQVMEYLKMEEKLMSEGKAPTHDMTVDWLEACADHFEDDVRKFVDRRKFSIMDEESLCS